MKSKPFRRTTGALPLAAAMAGLALTITTTFAGVITINNPGFEDASGTGTNGNLTTVADWTEEDSGNVYVDNNGLTWTPEVDRTLYLNAVGAAVNQDLSHSWSSSDSYTLGLVGIEPIWNVAATNNAFSVQLRQTDGTILWDSGVENLDGTVSGSPGNVSYTGTGHIFTWTIDANTFTGAGVVEGSPLNIRIAGEGSGTASVQANNYEGNLVNLINSLRDYYENRYPLNTVPNAPFVVASVGFGGGGWDEGSSADVIFKAQMAVGDPAQHPEFAGTVASVDTTGYWRDSGPSNQSYHYNHNAETYMLTGDAMGRGMVELLEGGTTPTSSLQITSITPVGGPLWELTLAGDPATGYEFYSSTTLDFTPGTLVTGLTQGNPGSNPGTIGGTGNSAVTTDAGGNATVRMTLSGNPSDFVRAQATP